MCISRRTMLAGVLGVVCLSLTGCQGDSAGPSAAAPDGKYLIVCTTAMVADIAQHVAGDRAQVISLFGAVDPHTYEPTAKDIEKIRAADVVLYSGLLLEGPTQGALESAARRGKLVVPVSEVLEQKPGYLRRPDGAQTHPDPHVWHDVSAWMECSDHVAEVLADYDPEGASGYRSRSAAYREELARVDRYARERIATIPERHRVLVTAHDAFEYFSRAYGIPVRAVQGITTASEAGTDDIVQLVDYLVANDVPAVFVEETVNRDNLRAVLAGARSKGKTVEIGGSLYSDSMGPTGTYEGTYVGMIDHNVTQIVRGLGGEAPARGMQGKLKE